MKKILFSFAVVALAASFLIPVPSGQTLTKSYYGGDAVNYNDRLVVATANTGKMELFLLAGDGNLKKFVSMKSYDPRFGKDVDFKDVLLNNEDGRLFAYAVDGKGVYKYDVSDLKTAVEVARVVDTTDYIGGLEKIGGYVSTVGTKGVTMYTGNLKAYDRYKIVVPGNYTFNTTSAGSDKFIFTVADDTIKIFDRESRVTLTDIPLSFKWGGERYKRSLVDDRFNNAVYVVDDQALRKVNFRGEIEKSFRHTGYSGYDVVSSTDNSHLYFSDGIGVVKLRKSDLSVVDYTYTQSLANGNGWAMGLQAVSMPDGDKVVLFNGSGIFVLDANLKPLKNTNSELTIATTTDEETYPTVIEPVSLAVDRNRAAANSTIVLRGAGYGQNENLRIEFADTIIQAQANEAGNFSINITVPSVKPRRTDIKVIGEASHISYSLGFQVE